MTLNDDIEEIEKPDGIYSPTIVVDNFSKLFLHPFTFLINDSRTTQKSLFPHTF